MMRVRLAIYTASISSLLAIASKFVKVVCTSYLLANSFAFSSVREYTAFNDKPSTCFAASKIVP